MSSYKDGAKAGRDGRDPHPPKYNGFIDPIFGLKKETVEKMAHDYKEGYAAGSQQRAADKSSRKK